MKKHLFALCIITLSFAKAQVFGLGMQSIDGNSQFHLALNIPWYNTDLSEKDKHVFAVYSGYDFVSSDADALSGHWLKPLGIGFDLFTVNNPTALAVGVEGGYLFSTGRGEDSWVVSPFFNYEIYQFIIKGGYQYHMRDEFSQFYIRINIGIGLSVGKETDNFNNISKW